MEKHKGKKRTHILRCGYVVQNRIDALFRMVPGDGTLDVGE